jgi:hypothetical protein
MISDKFSQFLFPIVLISPIYFPWIILLAKHLFAVITNNNGP